MNIIERAAPFTVRIIDPCDEPFSVTASVLTNQEYTITDDDALPYTVPVYTADPAWCAITYTYTITDVSGDAVLIFNDDPLVREFSFYYDADLLLCGLASTDYTVTVTGTAGNVVETSGSASFLLKLRNPCIDPAYITINQVPLPVGEQYILHDFKVVGGYTFFHDPFDIVTLPFQHDLCGGLTYTATFNGSPIDTTTKAATGMAYDTATQTFDIYSEDFALLGTRTITVAASLTTYPVTVTATPDASTTIEIINPCLDPFSLTATPQTNPADYEYSSAAYPTVTLALD